MSALPGRRGKSGPFPDAFLQQHNADIAFLTQCAIEYDACPAAYIKAVFSFDQLFRFWYQIHSAEYRLVIAENGITAAGGDRAGLLYAAETLCQIIEQQGGAPECVEILDAPDIGHRGYYLDETRGRVLKLEYLKKTVDRLCRYKINEFQLYIEHTYMFEGFSEMWRNETPLTAQEILELDRYCRQRCVELIPSLASFGHLYMLLSTRSYGELCELEDSVNRPFSFEGRMQHHTINASDERALGHIPALVLALVFRISPGEADRLLGQFPDQPGFCTDHVPPEHDRV